MNDEIQIRDVPKAEQIRNAAAYARLDLVAWRGSVLTIAERGKCAKCEYVDVGGVMVCRVCKRPAVIPDSGRGK